MKLFFKHSTLLFSFWLASTWQLKAHVIEYDFIGHHISFEVSNSLAVNLNDTLNDQSIQEFYTTLNQLPYQEIVTQMKEYKARFKLNDWLYYQMIRHTAEAISPKAANYNQYTLYKWFFLAKNGYDATLSYSTKHLMLYVKSNENIYGIPFFVKDNNQFVCLNYHDFGELDFSKIVLQETTIQIPEGQSLFSYKIHDLPDFDSNDYTIKAVGFTFHDKEYQFKIKVNPKIKNLFINYPVADFETYFNIPMSKETYGSLIPELKNYIRLMSQKDGIEYLMRFTRYSFLYKNDQKNFGKEKRLSPEQTIMYEYSDCDDRAGLFFYLVKEIYDLPMIAMLYPTHITIAVQFDKQYGKPVNYNGKIYTVCDPTPQAMDLGIGDVAKSLKHSKYNVVYEYNPTKYCSK